MRLVRLRAHHSGCRLDLDAEDARGHRAVGFRLVVVPGCNQAMTRLGANLPCTPFFADLLARLHRLRRQIELCFKEWKAYANL
jgi:hypothetical protein